MHPSYRDDSIRAVDAKFEAQKIAFAPLAFQAVRALLDLGLLRAVNDASDRGLSREEMAEAAGISEYGAGALAEIALGLGVFKFADAGDAGERFVLGKTGWFLLEDEMTRVNFNFVSDICYEGAAALGRSVKSGRPEGLAVFGAWATIYEALSSLPAKARESWFAFDHFYSDIAFPDALPLVFSRKPKRLLDIGGNTAKWAIACCRHDPEVRVTVVDLPGQTAVAERNAAAAGFGDRVSVHACDIFDGDLPTNADAVWMSQFLDCFSLDHVTAILEKIGGAVSSDCDVYVLEPLWDRQRFEAASYSLQAASLYFTCMANGESKMYRFDELRLAVEKAGFTLAEARHDLGSNCYSLLRFRKA
ncbi:MAG: class I SAM-dependent methyltransferase [Treponema sp.]|jgi:hypothetical protein|nr:class I SAM-dependent methyltransferase [Treponema sp.]